MKKNEYKNLYIIDKKILTPKEKINSESSSNFFIRPLKTIIGRPKIYDLETGKLIADEENLVVLKGREFIAQKMAGLYSGGIDYSNYEIRYFSVGSGAIETANGVQDPTDIDESLASPLKFNVSPREINTSSNDYRYINKGYFKRIMSTANDVSGNIQLIKEMHEINNADGSVSKSSYFTEIKFTLIIDKGELGNGPVKFNEAGLFAVKYVKNKPTNDYIMIAKFTTTTKNLGPNDGLKIEWSILV